MKEGDVLEAYKIEEVAERYKTDGSEIRSQTDSSRSDPTMSRRLLKAAEAIRGVVSMAILTELRDPRVKNVTVIGVEVLPDMKSAKVFVSIMGSERSSNLACRDCKTRPVFCKRKSPSGLSLAIHRD